MAELLTALVMAGSRRGPADAVAQYAGVSHKCLAPIAGQSMLFRVVETLRAHPQIGRILVSIENEGVMRQDPAVSGLLDSTTIEWVPAANNLLESFRAGLEHSGATPPILVTTGDNPLLSADILTHFIERAAVSENEAIAGFATREIIEKAYPEVVRTFMEFKDGSFSACNLFMLKSPHALEAANIFAGGGQFGKRAFRIFRALGFGTVMHYWRRDLTLAGFLARLSRRLGPRLGAVLIPVAEAAIDVDKASDFDLVQKILERGNYPQN